MDKKDYELLTELAADVIELRQYEEYLFLKLSSIKSKINTLCGLMKGLRQPRKKS